MSIQTIAPIEAILLQLDHDGPPIELSTLSLRNASENHQPLSESAVEPLHHRNLLQKIAVTALLSGLNFASSASGGLATVSLPAIAVDLALPRSLSFWPVSVMTLSTASTLLLAGAIADVLSPRFVEMVGSFVCSALMLCVGTSRTGSELVIMRAVQGIGFAMHLSSSVAIVTQTLEKGRGRNLAFSFLGLSQPLGFSFGLVIGGLLVDASGWRTGWYIFGGLSMALAIAGLWLLPVERRQRKVEEALRDAKNKVDWVGALLASSFMTLLSYLLA